MLRLYRQYLRNLKEKALMAKGDKSYLINAVADVALLEKLIKECNKDPDLKVRIFLVDGTELRIETANKQSNKSIDWER